jgi:hypothetical protein
MKRGRERIAGGLTMVVSMLAGVVFALGASGCGCMPDSLQAQSGPAIVGQRYVDTCSRSPHDEVDFDGQFWISSPLTLKASLALTACTAAKTTRVPAPVPPASLTLVAPNLVVWSNGAAPYNLVSVGRTEQLHCG